MARSLGVAGLARAGTGHPQPPNDLATQLPIEPQLARVNGHADDGVDAGGIELIDLLPRGDAARGRDAPRGRLPDGHDRLHVSATHEPLGVHMCVEELRAERLERPDGIDSRERQGSLPAVNHDAAAAAVHGPDHAFDADRLCE